MCKNLLMVYFTKVEGWTETAIHVFNRHNVSDDHEGEGHQVDERVKMLQLNEAMETFLLRLQIRVSGENGVAKILIHLVNPLETWAAKLNTVISGTQVLPMSEWQKLCEQLGDWANHVENAIDRVGLHVKENIPITEEIREEAVSVDAIVKDSRQWMKSVYSSIENEDGALVEQVSVLHADMVEWMVQVLLRLTEEKLENEQDEDENEEQKGEEIIDDKETFISTPDIKTARDGLAYRINILSNRLNKCCTDVLQEQLQAMLGLSGEGNTEMELRDLKRMGFECHQWTQTSDLLVEELTAKDAGQWVAPSWHHLRQNDPLAKKRQGIKSEEKLSVTAEDDRDTLERQSVHVIGSDENLTQEPLASVAIDKETVIETESPSVAVLASEAPIPLGRSSSPHDALLSAIDSLEQQLKASEALVLTAEGRASRAEEKLKAAQEQIEALEQQERKLQQEVKSQQQQLNQQQQSPRRGGPPSRGAGSRQVQGSKKGSSVYQPRRGTPDTVASGGIPSSGARK
ncbi:axonemal dynein light chain domain-containing protein 1-like [Corticium candelabrum]|uniref:axonemal dynein light chain domain-containing protein 1-like n=1 Tax=Corticium candelabrum TaxID=121492 RepID=UPI002E257026|nr:axonemal dynein light chain domain-containing protein 1-like [Corticium candelabrum]